MKIHPNKTAMRAVDACGGTYTSAQTESGYAQGHTAAIFAAMAAVADADALTADLLSALKPFASQKVNGEGNSSEIVPNGYSSADAWRANVYAARAVIARAAGAA